MNSKKKVMKKISELIRTMNKEKYLQERCQRILDSGAIEVTAFEDDFALPKTILCAALSEVTYGYMPFDSKLQKIARNLGRF